MFKRLQLNFLKINYHCFWTIICSQVLGEKFIQAHVVGLFPSYHDKNIKLFI